MAVDDDDNLTVFEMIIRRTIDSNGNYGFRVTMPHQFSFIEAMGMLGAAQWQLHQQMTDRYGGV